jgi:ABC-type Fe3+/spermidine/putrescine transport system ATPase subunit
MARLTITDLHKYYGQTHAVRGVSLDIPEGEFAVLVGPSGCGKSTLLRSIAGLEPIDDGSIRIDGEVVNDMRPRDRDIAMVFQNYALYPYMNVYENIAFGLRARKFAGGEIERRVAEAARMLDISVLSFLLGQQCQTRVNPCSARQIDLVALASTFQENSKAPDSQQLPLLCHRRGLRFFSCWEDHSLRTNLEIEHQATHPI